MGRRGPMLYYEQAGRPKLVAWRMRCGYQSLGSEDKRNALRWAEFVELPWWCYQFLLGGWMGLCMSLASSLKLLLSRRCVGLWWVGLGFFFIINGRTTCEAYFRLFFSFLNINSCITRVAITIFNSVAVVRNSIPSHHPFPLTGFN